MKNAYIAGLFLCIALGAIGAGVATSLIMRNEASLASAVPMPEPPSPPLPEYGELQQAYAELAKRLADVELSPAPIDRQPIEGFASKAEFESFRDEVRAWMETQQTPAPELTEIAENPLLLEVVAKAVEDIRKQEAVLKVQKAQEKKIAQREERLTKLAEWLALDGYQTNEMRKVITDKDERDDELIRLWESGADDDLVAETKRSDAARFYEQASRILTTEQYETMRNAYDRRSSGK